MAKHDTPDQTDPSNTFSQWGYGHRDAVRHKHDLSQVDNACDGSGHGAVDTTDKVTLPAISEALYENIFNE